MFNLTWIILTLVAVLFTTPTFAQDKALTEEQLASIQLPMDLDDPVFEYDSFGGMRMAVPKGFAVTPALRIYGDGKVVAGSSSPALQSCSMVLSQDQLNQFLNFVVNEEQFYDITKEELENKMADTGRQVFIADAPTSKFSINLQRGSNSVEIYALTSAVRTFSEIEEIKKLLEISKKCRKLIAVCHLGNEQQTNELLAKVNEKLKENHPNLDAFEAKDVRFATLYTDGKFNASFRKLFEATNDSAACFVSARVKRLNAKADYEITISEAKIAAKQQQADD